MATITFEYDVRNVAMQHMINAFVAIGARPVSTLKTAPAEDYLYENLNATSKTALKDTANYKKRKHYSSVSSLMDALNS